MDTALRRIWYLASVFPVTDGNGKIFTLREKLEIADKKFKLIQELCEEIMAKSKDRPAREKKKPKKVKKDAKQK